MHWSTHHYEWEYAAEGTAFSTVQPPSPNHSHHTLRPSPVLPQHLTASCDGHPDFVPEPLVVTSTQQSQVKTWKKNKNKTKLQTKQRKESSLVQLSG